MAKDRETPCLYYVCAGLWQTILTTARNAASMNLGQK